MMDAQLAQYAASTVEKYETQIQAALRSSRQFTILSSAFV
jgi:hypothetical protein